MPEATSLGDIVKGGGGEPASSASMMSSNALPIPTKSSTHSEPSCPSVPGEAVHLFRAKPSGLERGS